MKSKSNTLNKERKQAFNAKWDDSDTSSSDSDSETENTNMYFMEKDDQVWNFNKEITNVLNDMNQGYKILRKEYNNSLAEINRLKIFNERLIEEK